MIELDFFDLTGLSFDPPEKSAKKVKAAIDKKIKELGTSLGSETQQIKRDEKNAQLEFLKSISKEVFSSDENKLVEKEYLLLASQRIDAEMKRLKSTAYLMAQTGNLLISDGTIKFHRRERKLSEEHVKEVFSSLGFSVVNIDPLGCLPRFPTNAEQICTEIAALSRTKDPNPKGADTSLVENLYSFAAYLNAEPENAALYRSKTTAELEGLFDLYAKKFATRNDNLGKLCASLSTAAKKYVFNSEENHQAYRDFLKYKSPELLVLFESMRGANKADLHEARFAEPCIKRISDVFGDYEVALSIYNKEAGLKDDPYIPLKPVYHIKCDFCGRVSEFMSEAEAQQANQCTNCRKELFKKCSKCGKQTPVVKDKCPHCGFVFAGALLFGKYYRAAEEAFRKSDFESARKYLYDAQTADPNENQRISQLTARIDAEEKKYAQPINKLRELIAGKKFSTAEKTLYETIKQYPGLNVSVYEAQIQKAISQAAARYEALKRLPTYRQADECVEILRECVDYPAAFDFLRTHPPLPCKGFTAIADAHNGGIAISWANSQESGVTYRLERVFGNTDIRGGSEVLLDQVVDTSYKDLTAKPGQTYVYTVYAIRFGVSSEPVPKTVVLYADVRNLHIAQNRNCIRLTWDAPENSVGATVTRITDGKDIVLSRSAYGSLEDKDIQYGKAYTYRIQANYSDAAHSPGIESIITPLLIIDSFKIKVASVKDNVFKVSWDIKQSGVDLRILVNQKLALECKSDIGQAQIQLSKEAFNMVNVMAYSGGTWIDSDNTVEVNTFTSCGIDKKRTELREEYLSTQQGVWCNLEIKIRMSEPIPKNVQGFYYAVRKATDASRWAAISDIGMAADIQRISIKNYNNRDEIVYTETVKNETSFYISVFTIYAVGEKEIVSEPKTLRMDRPVIADIFWEVSRGFFGGMKLDIEVLGNRPLDHIPELALCACYENEFITSRDDPRAIDIKQIPSVELESPQKQYSQTYSVECSYSGKELKRLKFFLFETVPTKNENFTLRWQQGFMGKV